MSDFEELSDLLGANTVDLRAESVSITWSVSEQTAKKEFVEAYFARWDDDLNRAKTLLADQKYYLEAWLVLSCHIGAFASLRFPTLHDNEAYKGVVLQYSGMRDFYEQIDLLFFLQWPRSEFSSHGDFLKLKTKPISPRRSKWLLATRTRLGIRIAMLAKPIFSQL